MLRRIYRIHIRRNQAVIQPYVYLQTEASDEFLSTGGIDLKDEKNAALFEDCDGIVFVIDAQNELAEVKEAVNTMLFAVEKAHR